MAQGRKLLRHFLLSTRPLQIQAHLSKYLNRLNFFAATAGSYELPSTLKWSCAELDSLLGCSLGPQSIPFVQKVVVCLKDISLISV